MKNEQGEYVIQRESKGSGSQNGTRSVKGNAVGKKGNKRKFVTREAITSHLI